MRAWRKSILRVTIRGGTPHILRPHPPDIRMIRFRHVLAASVVLADASRHPLAAQTFPTNDPVIKHIYAMGMDSTHLYTEAHVLFDSLGPRLMGTPNIKRAQDWLVSMYKSWGIAAKEEQYG